MNKTTNKKLRGVYEHPRGSGIWWVQHFDSDGRRRREKVGTKSAAIALAEKRRNDRRKDIKLPDNLRKRSVLFREIAKAALEYSKQEKRSYRTDIVRMARLVEAFGDQPAESIRREEIERWLNQTAEERQWTLATKNRFLALLKLTYRLAEQNGKVEVNPTRLLRMKTENNSRIRWLGEFKPAPTTLAYLQNCDDEETCLRLVVATEYACHLPELEIALNCDCGRRRCTVYSGRISTSDAKSLP